MKLNKVKVNPVSALIDFFLFLEVWLELILFSTSDSVFLSFVFIIKYKLFLFLLGIRYLFETVLKIWFRYLFCLRGFSLILDLRILSMSMSFNCVILLLGGDFDSKHILIFKMFSIFFFFNLDGFCVFSFFESISF